MKLTPVETLKLQERIHSIIMAFGERERWTPAEGAMLVSGVRPPSQGIETIPEQAMQLLNEALAATQPQMLRARRVLEEWFEDRDYDREDGGTMFDADPTPSRFVEWCDETFSQKPRPFRPLWLEQFVFVALGSPSELPPPLPTELIDEMRAALYQASSTNRAAGALDEAAIEEAKRTKAWSQLERWAERKSTSPARIVVLAALRRLLAAATAYDEAFAENSFQGAKRATWEFVGGHLPSEGLVDTKTNENVDAATFEAFRSFVLPEFLKRTDRKHGARRVESAMSIASTDRIDQLAPFLETLNIRDLARRVFVNGEAVEDAEDSIRAISRMVSMNSFGSIVEFLRIVRMQEERLQGWSSRERIVLSTIERAKGLEFEHVIIPGLDRGKFEGTDEDERNLFYVAVSRARDAVQLIYSPGKAGAYVPVHLR